MFDKHRLQNLHPFFPCQRGPPEGRREIHRDRVIPDSLGHDLRMSSLIQGHELPGKMSVEVRRMLPETAFAPVILNGLIFLLQSLF